MSDLNLVSIIAKKLPHNVQMALASSPIRSFEDFESILHRVQSVNNNNGNGHYNSLGNNNNRNNVTHMQANTPPDSTQMNNDVSNAHENVQETEQINTPPPNNNYRNNNNNNNFHGRGGSRGNRFNGNKGRNGRYNNNSNNRNSDFHFDGRDRLGHSDHAPNSSSGPSSFPTAGEESRTNNTPAFASNQGGQANQNEYNQA
jgi:hypothetical protein